LKLFQLQVTLEIFRGALYTHFLTESQIAQTSAMNSIANTKKRILALDGGGIRGVFTIEILARIEKLLREATGKPDLLLCDHFQMIAGTSTGAIIASLLSWGLPVEAVKRLYLEQAEKMFIRAPWWRRSSGWFSEKNLSDMLRDFFVEADGSPALMGSSRLKTLLLLVMRNATTGSAWPLTNNPKALYNRRYLPDGTLNGECNLNIPLWQLVRASTAAPVYFPPEKFTLGSQELEFMDGGITAFNNPALIAFLTATQPCYHVSWPTGLEKLQLISIGTGQSRALISNSLRRYIDILGLASVVPSGLMDSISREQDLMCRVLGRTLYGTAIDSEITSVCGLDQFKYVRYNKEFNASEIAMAERKHGGRFSIDNVKMIDFLVTEGQDYAENVDLSHLI
jgi:hypothetical protein